MPNNSASGGYLVPTSSQPLPGGLTLDQFIQTVLVGISGYTNTLVRPKWQVAPPKQPDISTDWIAYGIAMNGTPNNAYVDIDDAGVTHLGRQESLEVQCAFYGPNAQENIAAFRDGFQLQQNLDAMKLANMGFKECSRIIRGPDLINERWVDRYEMLLTLVRRVQRVYPILSFASAMGTIHTVVQGNPVNIDWETEEPTP